MIKRKYCKVHEILYWDDDAACITGQWSIWEQLSSCLLEGMHWRNAERELYGPLWEGCWENWQMNGYWKIMAKDSIVLWPKTCCQEFPDICGWLWTVNPDDRVQKLHFCYFPGHTFLDKGYSVGSTEKFDISICWDGAFYVIFKTDLSLDSICKFDNLIASAVPTPRYWTLQT